MNYIAFFLFSGKEDKMQGIFYIAITTVITCLVAGLVVYFKIQSVKNRRETDVSY